MKCRASGKPVWPLFNLGQFEVSDFLEADQVGHGGGAKYPLNLVMGPDSLLVQLDHTVPREVLYGERYWYRSGTTNTMRNELKDIAEAAAKCVPYEHRDIFLDIASNDGTLLSHVPVGFTKIGIDPVEDSFQNQAYHHADDLVQDFFSKDAYCSSQFTNHGAKKAKVITCVAMFYDLEDPVSFLDDVNWCLDDEGVLVLQMSYTPLMVRQLAFDNICHEHLCYYTLHSLEYVLNQAGFMVVDVELTDSNGGSFRVYARKYRAKKELFKSAPYRDVAKMRIESMLEYEHTHMFHTPAPYKQFYSMVCNVRAQVTEFIRKRIEEGSTIYGYGASTKGNTLLQWYNLNSSHITAIAEKSPYKLGRYTVGSEIPIVSEKDMRMADPDYLFILPWHFIHEFTIREQEYRDNGGRFIVPCPQFKIIGG